jgi:DNA polymerase III subunit gamma/tau
MRVSDRRRGPDRPLDSTVVPPASASLYRRHRPRSFADVVGQEHVVRTLSNAIGQGKVHHAYLFVGSRGTGKTSMAKILAASLNCERGPTTEPCGVCESCVSIATASSLDVIEMDAASNNSVDDIRDLREKVAYAPVSGRHKVYILDEAHMLSTAAWNAFLKTLEEPPPHTIFVLATTEANKVLPTVVDRCHRFDFGRPTVTQITTVLRRVAEAEQISIPDEACGLIARSATGSFRDALGTLEQLLAYSGPTIELGDVLAVLGAADADLLFGAIDAVSAGDARSALLAAARLADSGRDIGRFFGDLETHARALMVVQTLGGEVPPELEVTAEQDERLREQAARVSATDVVRMLDLIAAGLRAMKDGSDARTQLELALVKAAVPKVDASAKALQSRLERLEAGRPALAPPPAGGRAPGVPATAAGRAAEPPRAAVPAAPAQSPAPVERVEAEPSITPAAVIEPEGEGQEPVVAAVGLDLDAFGELWPAIIESIQTERPLLAEHLKVARPASLGHGELTLAWAETHGLSMRKAEDAANRELIGKAIRAVTGASLRLAHELRADTPEVQAPTLSADELIDRFVEEFEAEILPEPDRDSEETS